MPLHVDDALLELQTPLRRYAATLVDSGDEIDDVVQETMLRLLATGDRLEPESLTAYAFVVARNLVHSSHRRTQTARRHAPVLIDLRQPDRPDEAAVVQEEKRALATALSGLPAPQRDVFLAHEAHEQPLSEVAAERGTSTGALAAQLGRTRARLRLDYVLALRRTSLATPRCRAVLLALSAGDQRAQQRLSAARHLLTCETCAELSEPLFKRERALAGALPWLPLAALPDRLTSALRRSQVQIGTAVVAVVGAAAIAVAWNQTGDPPAPRSSPAASSATASAAAPVEVLASGAALLRASDLGPHRGQQVRAVRARVISVPADEGFWIEASRGQRVWVELTGSGESRVKVRAGQLVSFRGHVAAHGAAYPTEVGVTGAEGARDLARNLMHIEVRDAALSIEPV